jgi:hypothetical protein
LVGLYDLQYKIAADYDLILRLFISGLKFHYVNTPLAAYSLNGMSSAANFFERAKLIKECWRVSKQAAKYEENNLDSQRSQAYIKWVVNEVFAIPARYFLKPPTARKVKAFINRYIKKPVSDDYGKW